MRRIILESPFAGNVRRNIAYAKLCVKDVLQRGEAPIASHLLFTQPGILDDLKPEERKLGIGAGHAWIEVADAMAVYQDFGISNGMLQAIEKARILDKTVEARHLPIELVNRLKADYPD